MSDIDKIVAELGKDKELQTFHITKLSDPTTLATVKDWLSTGCTPLDYALGGGFPVRRITEIYGDNSTGKTLFAAQAVISTQELGGLSVFADAEIALGVDRMIELGIDPDRLIYADVNTVDDVMLLFEKSIEMKNKHLGQEAVMTFIWDSVAAIATKEEMEKTEDKGWEQRQYPAAARLISAAFRQIPRMVAQNNVCFIMTNQVRQNIGVMFGDGATTYGGNAIKFYSSLRLELQNRGKIKPDKQVIGVKVDVIPVKNRLAPPYRTVRVPMYYKHGIDDDLAIFELLKTAGLLSQGGAWYTIILDEQEVKFQRKGFREIVAKHYDAILDLIENMYETIEDEEEQDEE